MVQSQIGKIFSQPHHEHRNAVSWSEEVIFTTLIWYCTNLGEVKMFDYISHKICDQVFLCFFPSWMFKLFATHVSDPIRDVVEDGLACLNDLVSYMIL